MNSDTFLTIILSTKESREPRVPMKICKRSFELVDQHLSALGYSGPVALSCDDTKLFKSWWIYWDAEKNSHFLVGGVGEPVQVADPECLREIIEKKNLIKASKV